jgi:hypothetical protein
MSQAMDRDRFLVFCRALALCGLLFGLPHSCVLAAGLVLDAGFEPPGYSTTGGTLANGVLQGQSGWLWDGTAAGQTGHSIATVQTAVVKSGSQAVSVSKLPNSDRHWAMPKSGLPSQRFVAIDWDMRVSQAPDSPQYGPFFGVDSKDRTSGQARVLGTLGVEASTGLVFYQESQTGFFGDTGVAVPFDQWNHFRIVLDFITDSYRGFVNGVNVVTTGFVDDTVQTELNTFSDADITAVATGSDAISQGLTSTAYFDNFVIRDGLAGDYDLDGDVDNADYDRWRATFGQSVVSGNLADGNGNGIVDAADYVVWRNNLGASLFMGVSPGLGAAAISVVPEPAAVVLGLAGLSAAAFLRTSRRVPLSVSAQL